MSPPTTTTTTLQLLSISTALLSSGGIATLTLFSTPSLQSLPASRSLPQTRWLFSRGSHIFPQSAFLSASGFFYLAYSSLPSSTRHLTQLLHFTSNSAGVNAYLAAAALTISIAPWTALVMIPTNFELIKMNEEAGGARSQGGAEALKEAGYEPGERSAEDSVYSKGEGAEFTDLSGPQGETARETSRDEDERARELLERFGVLNAVRAVLMGAGGVVGLWAALAG